MNKPFSPIPYYVWKEVNRVERATAILLTVTGAVCCIYGHRLLPFWNTTAGLCGGTVMGAWIGLVLLPNAATVTVLSAACGLLGAATGAAFPRAGAIVAGAVEGSAYGLLIGGIRWSFSPWVTVLGAIVGALASFLPVYPLLGTSFGGAVLLVGGIFCLMMPMLDLPVGIDFSFLSGGTAAFLLLSAVIFGLSSAGWQWNFSKRFPKSDKMHTMK